MTNTDNKVRMFVQEYKRQIVVTYCVMVAVAIVAVAIAIPTCSRNSEGDMGGSSATVAAQSASGRGSRTLKTGTDAPSPIMMRIRPQMRLQTLLA